MMFDCIIIGAGPAGLSAAIYLGRFRRSVLLIDNHHGRSTYPQLNEDYLGFPEGVHALKLREMGKIQAEKFGAHYTQDTVVDIKITDDQTFKIEGENKKHQSKTVILATGVTDILPVFDECQHFFGSSIFWCITCDGYKAIDKKILIIGNNNDAAVTALQFLIYTKQITFLTNCTTDKCEITEQNSANLEKYQIPVIHKEIKEILGENSQVQKVVFKDNTEIAADLIYTMQGSNPNNQLAKNLNLKLDTAGFITIDKDQRTSLKGAYAAGDITRPYSHQICSAVHEGSMAAQAINYDLFKKEFSKIS